MYRYRYMYSVRFRHTVPEIAFEHSASSIFTRPHFIPRHHKQVLEISDSAPTKLSAGAPFGAHTLPHYRAVQQSPGELVDTRSVRRSAVESETQTSHRRTCDSLLCGVSSSLISIAQCPMGLCCLCTRLHACGTGWLHCLRDKVALRRSPDSTASKLTASRQI